MRTGQPTCESTGPAAASTRTRPLVLPPWEARLCLAGEGELGAFELRALRVEAWEVAFCASREVRMCGLGGNASKLTLLRLRRTEPSATLRSRPLRRRAVSKGPPPREPRAQSCACCPRSHRQLPATAGTAVATACCKYVALILPLLSDVRWSPLHP